MERDCVVDVYPLREQHQAEDAWGNPLTAQLADTPAAADVHGNLQPISGSVRQVAAGREIDASYQLFIPGSVPVAADWGIVVRGVITPQGAVVEPPPAVPRRFRVRHAAHQGEDWDTELLLGATLEAFGAAEAG